MSWLDEMRTYMDGAMASFRVIEQGREDCELGSPEAEAGADASLKCRAILRKMLDDSMVAPLDAANVWDRWAILQLAVEAFGVADVDVARVASAFGLEADMAGRRCAVAAE